MVNGDLTGWAQALKAIRPSRGSDGAFYVKREIIVL